MKRTDLIALAERLAHAAEYVRSASPTLSEPDAAWVADQDAAVSLMRQIAQAHPVAWRVRSCGQFKRFNPGPWRIYWSAAKPNVNAPQDCDFDPLYTLPLED